MHLPSVIRQVGKVTGENRVYIEDYAYTYLNNLKKEKHGLPVRAALYGYAFSRENIHFYLVYGASCVIEELENGKDQEEIKKMFFDDYRLIGYINIYGKEKQPDTEEGCCIFYETNEAMQNYMLYCYKRKQEDRQELSHAEQKREAGKRPTCEGIVKLLEKVFLSIAVMLAATAVVTIDNYKSIYDFTVKAARALLTAMS